jgi:hypothetical protein
MARGLGHARHFGAVRIAVEDREETDGGHGDGDGQPAVGGDRRAQGQRENQRRQQARGALERPGRT